MTPIEALIALATVKAINAALETDQDALAVAKDLRKQIRSAWHKALNDAGVPEELQKTLRFPL